MLRILLEACEANRKASLLHKRTDEVVYNGTLAVSRYASHYGEVAQAKPKDVLEPRNVIDLSDWYGR